MMTPFAARVVGEKLVQEAQNAVKPVSGLHPTRKKRGSQKIEWEDIGTTTVTHVGETIRKYQPLAWDYATRIA